MSQIAPMLFNESIPEQADSAPDASFPDASAQVNWV